MELFATNLRRRAEELGLSNAEVARRAGLSERRYGNYVSGRREPDLATLVKIAAVLASSPNDLLVDQQRATVPDELERERAAAALVVLEGEDLRRARIIVEALAAERT
ncbi:helix-turn-helix transcriptional regulator [Mesorhizobium sp. M0184]|uniref:helix-turn-helix domain-containing protein n=1 Tax=Mesorhizobium sp. M0184 TaxID=2956906 RepID=UPI003337552F